MGKEEKGKRKGRVKTTEEEEEEERCKMKESKKGYEKRWKKKRANR